MKKPRKTNKTASMWQTHVYLTEVEHKQLVEIAAAECRSPTSQIQYFVRKGLAAYDNHRKGE